MPVSVRTMGVEKLRQALRDLPPDLADATRRDVETATMQAAAELRAIYPRGDTGKLRAGVKTQFRTTKTGTVGIVRSTSPHAHLWEYGTVNRQTQRGWNRGRMASQRHRGLLAIAARERRTLKAAVIARLQEDFQVTDGGE